MARRLFPNSDAWGGAWGSASAWGGAWGWSWGPLHEVEDPTYYGGGNHRHKETAAERTRLLREHWDYLDGLHDIQVQVSDDVRGARTISIPVDMPLPESIAAPAMRGNVRTASPPTVADILGDPLALSMLALLIDDEE